MLLNIFLNLKKERRGLVKTFTFNNLGDYAKGISRGDGAKRARTEGKRKQTEGKERKKEDGEKGRRRGGGGDCCP